MNAPQVDQPAPRPSGGIGSFMIGFAIAIVFSFVLNLNLLGGFGSRIPIGSILLAWGVTAGLIAFLYWIRRWLAYGFLGGYAALFLLTLMGGVFGPYTCFGIYGYPHS